MKILYVYRNPNMGFSIGKVFKSIEKEMKKYVDIDCIYLPCSNYSIRSLLTNIRYLLNHVKNKNYDIIHITGTENYLLPFLRKYKTVVTVHDLGFYTEKRKSIHLYFKYLLWIKTLRLSKFITFISKKSMDDTLKLIEVKNYKVIYNPIDREFLYSPKVFNKSVPKILHIGTRDNKNLIRTIKALKNFPCELRIIGELNNEQKQTLKDYNITFSNSCNLSDREIIEEYQKCDIVNFPSTYEGFGMPIIEAQAIGRIVVTSNIEPMNTIANGAAVYVNPYDINSIKIGYEKAINFDENIIKLGLKNAQRFDINIITKQYLQVYKLLKK